MNIVIDLVHPADVNFYKNSINILMKRNVGVNLIVRPRGRLLSILQKEFPHTDPKIIGKHYSNIHGKIVGLIKRELELLFYLNKIDFDVSLGGFMIGYASRILHKPCVTFEDDYEYKIPFYLAKFTATRHVMPECIPATGKNMYKYKGLKEIAYLHPRYFKPDKEILEQYKLRPQEYVFIREIANTSLNYKNTSAKLHKIIEYLKEMGFQIVVSLENKSLIERFKKNCIILEEPVEDIYSLLKFAALTISSGDTMARESCLVGTPTIYTGGRDMYVNEELIRKECMFKVDDIEQVPITVKYILENDMKKHIERIIGHAIKHEWEDTTEIIIENLIDVLND